jgi:hypothetical protein
LDIKRNHLLLNFRVFNFNKHFLCFFL